MTLLSSDTKRTFLDALICVYLLTTIGGLITTVTHEVPLPFFAAFTGFSYGMLAPYQGDNDQNVELAAVGIDAFGRTTLIPIDRYYPGRHGERNVRQRLEIYIFKSEHLRGQSLVPFFTQILEHERSEGHPYVRLDFYADQWTRSPEGYDALRMHATHTLITSVR